MNSSPTTTVRYGIIGCGMMGQEHLRNIALLPGACVTLAAQRPGQVACHDDPVSEVRVF